MKKFILPYVIFTILSIQGFSQSKLETEVTQSVEQLRKAMVDADRSTLEKISAAELSYGHSSGKVENKAAFIEALTSGKSDFTRIDLTDQTIKVVGKTAIVRHRLSGETRNGGTTDTVNLNILLIWQKQKGGWKLLARQAARVI